MVITLQAARSRWAACCSLEATWASGWSPRPSRRALMPARRSAAAGRFDDALGSRGREGPRVHWLGGGAAGAGRGQGCKAGGGRACALGATHLPPTLRPASPLRSAFSFVAAKTACYLKSISGWRLAAWPGAQSVILCPKPYPGSGYLASPPFPPRCGLACSSHRPGRGEVRVGNSTCGAHTPAPPSHSIRSTPLPAPCPVRARSAPPPAAAAALLAAPWKQDVVPNSGRKPGAVSAASLGGAFLPLALPPCSFGRGLNFVGRFIGASQVRRRTCHIQM